MKVEFIKTVGDLKKNPLQIFQMIFHLGLEQILIVSTVELYLIFQKPP
jgi:hypothetical protein